MPDLDSVARPRRETAVIAVLAASGLVGALVQTVVVPIIPQLPVIFDTTRADASWALSATTLAGAASIPVTSRLAGMHGKRRMQLIVLVSLLAGSLVAVFADTLGVLIVGRVLQGVGTAAIPIGISILRDTVSARRLPGAVGTVSATMGIGGALGLTLAAGVAETFGWRAPFLLTAGVAIALITLTLTIVPESPLRSPGSFDWAGAALFAGALTGILIGLVKGNDWGWNDPRTLAAGGIGVSCLLAWIAVERRVARPLVDLGLLRRPPIRLTNLTAFTLGTGLFLYNASIPVLLVAPDAGSDGFGLSLTAASACLAPIGALAFLVSPFAFRVIVRHGPRTALWAGCALVTCGYTVGAISLDEIWLVVVMSCLVGTGTGLAYAAIPSLIIGAAPVHETASATGFNTVSRTIGQTSGAAGAGLILAASQGAGAYPQLAAYHLALVIAASAVAVGAVFALLIPRTAPPPPDELPLAGEAVA